MSKVKSGLPIRVIRRPLQLVHSQLRRMLLLPIRLVRLAAWHSPANLKASFAIVRDRCSATSGAFPYNKPNRLLEDSDLPQIDISIVTFNSERWIENFVASISSLDYPMNLLNLIFVDNQSTDGTVGKISDGIRRLQQAGADAELIRRDNRGFGAGHNSALKIACNKYCLITNVDVEFESNALRTVVTEAIADQQNVAAWELRQKPYEHPKFYDPVLSTTEWNSYACVLVRRDAVIQVGMFDETLFMYGEDVELSYRLRRAGFLLRYCSKAVVWHYTYEDESTIKPLQYSGSAFANLYIRLKYGTWRDIFAIPSMAATLWSSNPVYPNSSHDIRKSLLRLLTVAHRAILGRRRSKVNFSFRGWDYSATRDGAFFALMRMPDKRPLVSIVTRTYQGRQLYLRQSMLSVVNQTYDNIEHIVVEDGGDTHRSCVQQISSLSSFEVRYISLPKVGRSKAGNAGLSVARGKYCLFLDDDDLLFHDHVEVLYQSLRKESQAVAAYSLAWEVITDASLISNGTYIETDHRVSKIFRQEFDFSLLTKYNYLPIQSVLFERRLFEARGGFDEDIEYLEDWLLWLRYAIDNYFVYVPKTTSIFRTPADLDLIERRKLAFDQAMPIAVAKVNEMLGRS